MKLGDEHAPSVPDDFGRTWAGWSPQRTLRELYDVNRRGWRLGARAVHERWATFSHTFPDGPRVVLVVEIECVEDVARSGEQPKQAIRGRILDASDPMHAALMALDVDRHRNPVTYLPDPPEAARTCACGCGGTPAPASAFLSGHDQRAVHERIARRWGSTLEFVRWFDAGDAA